MAVNYFELLGLPVSFDVDNSTLNKAYMAIQQQYHPDRLVGKPDDERGRAIQISMDANEGYEALKNPLTRAQHILELQGIRVNTDGEDTIKPDQALLVEVMELREQMADAKTEGDAARMIADLRKAMDLCIDDIAEALESEDYRYAAQQVIRLRYLGKSLEEAMMHQYRLKEAS